MLEMIRRFCLNPEANPNIVNALVSEGQRREDVPASLQMQAARVILREDLQKDIGYYDANYLRGRISDVYFKSALTITPRVLKDQGIGHDPKAMSKVLSLTDQEIIEKAQNRTDLPLATEYALLISDNARKSQQLRYIANTYRNADNLEEFTRLMTESERAANLIPDNESKSMKLLHIVDAYIQAGNLEEAERVANLIPNNENKSWELRNIANVYRNADNLEGFTRLMIESERAANLILDNAKKSDELINIANVYSNADNLQEYQRLILQAEEVANLIPDNTKKSWGLLNAAEAYRRVGDLDAFQRILLQAEEEEVNLIPDNRMKYSVLRSIAEAYRRVGNLEEAERVANLIPDNAKKSSILLYIAEAYRQLGNNSKYYQLSLLALYYGNRKKIWAVGTCITTAALAYSYFYNYAQQEELA